MWFAWSVAFLLVAGIPLSLYAVPPIQLFLAGGLVLVAASTGWRDRWLMLFAVYMVMRWALEPKDYGFVMVVLIVLAVAVIAACQQAPTWADTPIRMTIIVVGLVQIGQAIFQVYGYDPLWFGLSPSPNGSLVHGTLGNSNYLGAYLAISSAVVPVVLLPLWGLGIVLAKSAVAGVAAAACLLIRFRRQWRVSVPLVGLGLACVALLRGFDASTTFSRIAFWGTALHQWAKRPFFGYGPGAWMRGLFHWESAPGHAELWLQAHNEYVQILFEGGIVAAAIVVMWLYTHRKAFLVDPWGPAMIAIAVDAAGMFPFQIPAVAILCLVCIGLGTRRKGVG